MMIHKQRQEARTVIAVEAEMAFGTDRQDAILANASSRGVLALVADPPRRGMRVQLIVGGGCLRGQVRWRGAGRCGIALDEPIDVAGLQAGRVVPVRRVAMAHVADTYRGPAGLLRTLTSDVTPSRRILNAFVLAAALASAGFVLARLGSAALEARHGAPVARYAAPLD